MSIGDAFPKGFYGDDVYDESKVYILFDKIGGLIAVYRSSQRAIDRAANEVCKDRLYSSVHVDAYDYVIYVQGDLGEVTIIVEDVN